MKVALVLLLVIGVAYCVPTCPPEGNDAIHLPNPEDCSTFYICANGEPVLKECMPGLWYNPELRVCDFPENIPEGICKPPPQ